MHSMMVPSVVTGPDGGLLVAGGAAGGSRIRPALLQVLAGVLVEGIEVAEAVDGTTLVGGRAGDPPGARLPGRRRRGLEADGEKLVLWPRPRPYFGGVAAAAAGGPAADPRRGGSALVQA